MWILPTLNRPEQCAEVLDCIKKTECSTRGVIFVNGDWDSYIRALKGHRPENWTVIGDLEGKNLGAIGALNRILNLFPSEPFYGFIGDDEFIEGPKNWDQLLIAAAGDWDISHGWENWNNGKRFQGGVCIGGKLARAVGYLGVPTCFHGWGFDCMWEWMAAHPAFGGGGACRNIFVPEVKVYHKHHMAGETEIDSCYQLAIDHWPEDKNKFWTWVTKEMPLVAQRVKRMRQDDRTV